MALDHDEMENRFMHHRPKDEQTVQAHETVRLVLMRTAYQLEHAGVPAGREWALVLTKLEEVMFWANAGIARHGATPGV